MAHGSRKDFLFSVAGQTDTWHTITKHHIVWLADCDVIRYFTFFWGQKGETARGTSEDCPVESCRGDFELQKFYEALVATKLQRAQCWKLKEVVCRRKKVWNQYEQRFFWMHFHREGSGRLPSSPRRSAKPLRRHLWGNYSPRSRLPYIPRSLRVAFAKSWCSV